MKFKDKLKIFLNKIKDSKPTTWLSVTCIIIQLTTMRQYQYLIQKLDLIIKLELLELRIINIMESVIQLVRDL